MHEFGYKIFESNVILNCAAEIHLSIGSCKAYRGRRITFIVVQKGTNSISFRTGWSTLQFAKLRKSFLCHQALSLILAFQLFEWSTQIRALFTNVALTKKGRKREEKDRISTEFCLSTTNSWQNRSKRVWEGDDLALSAIILERFSLRYGKYFPERSLTRCQHQSTTQIRNKRSIRNRESTGSLFWFFSSHPCSQILEIAGLFRITKVPQPSRARKVCTKIL